jgi:uncharacterized BrkB/YihY/UPF0761 family membrane protein
MLYFHGMPNPINVLFAMVIAKFIGYSIAGALLQKIYGRGPNFLIFALLRIVLGFVFGLAFLIVGFSVEGLAASLLNSSSSAPLSGIPILLSLITSRLLIWAALVWLFYERQDPQWKRFAVGVILGTIFSFLVDLLSIYLFEFFEGYYDGFLRSVSI